MQAMILKSIVDQNGEDKNAALDQEIFSLRFALLPVESKNSEKDCSQSIQNHNGQGRV